MNRTPDLTTAAWRKSSYSDGGASNCLEVSDNHPGTVPVRDSKQPHGPILVFGASPWVSFLAAVKGESAVHTRGGTC
ncbi:DUF397 domain-containing protein [Streptomyces sp. DH10]|uniref:DUF397 domain-containing protein n=1 Tax=Streptomyces sp. DH10 TaxID=3040121 RepID=UPI002441C0CD|nr:DUF397 domain-containing protein [Streptomyces sp. DH10]MDG9707337.1 DUF397 domain-containing protein [Streptomyces sp. DH10]